MVEAETGGKKVWILRTARAWHARDEKYVGCVEGTGLVCNSVTADLAERQNVFANLGVISAMGV